MHLYTYVCTHLFIYLPTHLSLVTSQFWKHVPETFKGRKIEIFHDVSGDVLLGK